MRIIDNIKTFLYDKNYFINIFDDKIHIFNYLNLVELNDKEIILAMDGFNLEIKGSNLHVIRMASLELMIKGNVDSLRFKR